MNHEIRTVIFDLALQVEALHFQGVMQPFPNHFHAYYVIGFIEKGRRQLSCKNKLYTLEPGDMVLYNPGDNHACAQIDGKAFNYRSIHIQPEVMRKAVFEVTGQDYLPVFAPQANFRSELVPLLKELHQKLMQGASDFKKEELFYFLLEQLLIDYTKQETPAQQPALGPELQAVCEFLESHYMESITLNDLCCLTGLRKYTLLRAFTKWKSISPYSYLETIRIDRAKELLAQGVPPLETALQTGFNDQSHFSNFFKKFIGLTPKQYMNIFSTDAALKRHHDFSRASLSGQDEIGEQERADVRSI